MAKILIIETATNVCSVALTDNGQVIAHAEAQNTLLHSSLLTVQIDQCCRSVGITLREIDAVAVSMGPGSYTGLRVGASVAKGICYALDKPLMAVETLAGLALAGQISALAHAESHAQIYYVPMIDARRNEVWTAIYDPKMEILSGEAVPLILENDDFMAWLSQYLGNMNDKWIVVSGNGAFKAVPAAAKGINLFISPVQACSALYLAKITNDCYMKGQFVDVAYFEPFYMKAPNITIPKNLIISE
jgi:tRNA threonylcarbamoyladenosine biosynthesis protein TsaB